MGLIIQWTYNYIFKYFLVPAFILMLFGKPRSLINLFDKILKAKTLKNLSVGNIITFIVMFILIFSFLKINKINSLLESSGSTFNDYVTEKIREAHLYERNCYMFFTFLIIIIVLYRLTSIYKKYWLYRDAYEEYINKVAPSPVDKKNN
jgi:hypothetical protein